MLFRSEGEFPDYRQVLPTSWKRQVIVEAQALADACKRVAVMASGRNSLVQFEFTSDRLVLSSRNVDAGDAREEVPTELAGPPLTTGFNVKYVLDVLSATRTARLTMELGEALDPCVIRADGRDDCLFIIMPMRLD